MTLLVLRCPPYAYDRYDIGQSIGFVNAGTDHDTGEFVVTSIRCWSRHEGEHLYPDAVMIHLLMQSHNAGK